MALLAVLVAVVPPALATATRGSPGKYSPWIGDRVYLFALRALVVPIAARAVKQRRSRRWRSAIGLLAVLVAAGVVAYTRLRAVRLFVGYSIVLPVLGFVLVRPRLTVAQRSAEAAAVRVTSPTPVVFIVLDEMAASSLMARDGSLDPCPLSELRADCANGTWYRNATTAHWVTTAAVPSTLNRKARRQGRSSRASRTIATISSRFSVTRIRFASRESMTRLCPSERPPPRPRRSTLATGYRLGEDSINSLVRRTFPPSLTGQVVDGDVARLIEPDYDRVDELPGDARRAVVRHDREHPVLRTTICCSPTAPYQVLPVRYRVQPRAPRRLVRYRVRRSPGRPALARAPGVSAAVSAPGRVRRHSSIGRVLRSLEHAGMYDRSPGSSSRRTTVSFRPGATAAGLPDEQQPRGAHQREIPSVCGDNLDGGSPAGSD